MPVAWTDASDKKLLLSVIHLGAPQLPKWEQVAELMGEDYTAESTRQHFMKLRRDCKTMFGDSGPRTPTPKKSAQKTEKTSTCKRKAKKAAAEMVDDDDNVDNDANGDESPTKKMRQEKSEEE